MDWEKITAGLNTRPWQIRPQGAGLLLIDMQEYFRPLAREIMPGILSVLAAARKLGIPVFFTRHRHLKYEDTGMLGQWWGDLIWEGTLESRLLEELKPQPQENIIEKNRYSAFYKTGLEQALKDEKVTDLIIGGVMTNLCCETSARDAFVRDYRVFFLVDGTATASAEYHLATLKNLSYGFATLLTCRQLNDTLKD